MKIFFTILIIGILHADYIPEYLCEEVDECMVAMEVYGVESAPQKCIGYKHPMIAYFDLQDIMEQCIAQQ